MCQTIQLAKRQARRPADWSGLPFVVLTFIILSVSLSLQYLHDCCLYFDRNEELLLIGITYCPPSSRNWHNVPPLTAHFLAARLVSTAQDRPQKIPLLNLHLHAHLSKILSSSTSLNRPSSINMSVYACLSCYSFRLFSYFFFTFFLSLQFLLFKFSFLPSLFHSILSATSSYSIFFFTTLWRSPTFPLLTLLLFMFVSFLIHPHFTYLTAAVPLFTPPPNVYIQYIGLDRVTTTNLRLCVCWHSEMENSCYL